MKKILSILVLLIAFSVNSYAKQKILMTEPEPSAPSELNEWSSEEDKKEYPNKVKEYQIELQKYKDNLKKQGIDDLEELGLQKWLEKQQQANPKFRIDELELGLWGMIIIVDDGK